MRKAPESTDEPQPVFHKDTPIETIREYVAVIALIERELFGR